MSAFAKPEKYNRNCLENGMCPVTWCSKTLYLTCSCLLLQVGSVNVTCSAPCFPRYRAGVLMSASVNRHYSTIAWALLCKILSKGLYICFREKNYRAQRMLCALVLQSTQTTDFMSASVKSRSPQQHTCSGSGSIKHRWRRF